MTTANEIVKSMLWVAARKTGWIMIENSDFCDCILACQGGREMIFVDLDYIDQDTMFKSYEVDPVAFDAGDAAIGRETGLASNSIADLVDYMVDYESQKGETV